MAFLLGCEKVCIDYPTKRVFDSVSLGVDDGARIGIVGRNGDGKSTLLRLLAGMIEPEDGFEEGRVVTTRGVRVGLLGQRDNLCDSNTVHEAIVGTMPEYEWAGSPAIRGIIAGLVADIPWEAQVGTLSGGQRRRVDLARLLVGDWDVLMLDEPTNHLDVCAISWLAQHLKTRWKPGQGALLVVTHDRWFLDEVCTSMWEVHDGRIEPFEGGFSAYIMQRVERDRLAQLAEQKRQNQLRRELAWLSRGARARATKPKFHVAAAQALIADVPELRNPLELKRMAMARLGKQVVDLEEVSLSFTNAEGQQQQVLNKVSWIIGPGDRYGIVGENGAGKTSLLKVLQGVLEPTSGKVKIGQTVRFAVLSQHLDELTKLGTDRVRQVISRYNRRIMLDGKEQSPAQLLEKLGFTRADLNEPVSDLSGGQRRRLALMLILLDEPNVLILDEPGNDMDVDMLAVVEDMLDSWPGTLLLVTHDRYLMERVTDDQFALINGSLRHLPGGIDEYLSLQNAKSDEEGLAAWRKTSASAAGGRSAGVSLGGVAQGSAAGKGSAGEGLEAYAGEGASLSQGAAGVTGEAGAPKAAAKPVLSGGEIRTLRKLMISNEGKIATLKGKIEAAKAAMQAADPSDYVALTKAQDEIAGYQSKIDQLELEWLEAAEKLGE